MSDMFSLKQRRSNGSLPQLSMKRPMQSWSDGASAAMRRSALGSKRCLRRELNFIAKLPHSEPLRGEKARTLEWCVGDHDYFSDVSFQQREEQGQIETLRYLGTPDWIIRAVFRARAVISVVHRLVQRFARPPRQAQ
jgi:hypothetical protein